MLGENHSLSTKLGSPSSPPLVLLIAFVIDSPTYQDSIDYSPTHTLFATSTHKQISPLSKCIAHTLLFRLH